MTAEDFRLVPDNVDYEAAKADPTYATASDAEKYRLAQAAKLVRLNCADEFEAQVVEFSMQYIRDRVAQGWTKEQAAAHLKKLARDHDAEEKRKTFRVVPGDKD